MKNLLLDDIMTWWILIIHENIFFDHTHIVPEWQAMTAMAGKTKTTKTTEVMIPTVTIKLLISHSASVEVVPGRFSWRFGDSHLERQGDMFTGPWETPQIHCRCKKPGTSTCGVTLHLLCVCLTRCTGPIRKCSITAVRAFRVCEGCSCTNTNYTVTIVHVILGL